MGQTYGREKHAHKIHNYNQRPNDGRSLVIYKFAKGQLENGFGYILHEMNK